MISKTDQIFLLDCLSILYSPLTIQAKIGCHRNEAQVHYRQISVCSMTKGKMTNALCKQTRTFAETDLFSAHASHTYSHNCIHTSGLSGSTLLSSAHSCLGGLYASWTNYDVCYINFALPIIF